MLIRGKKWLPKFWTSNPDWTTPCRDCGAIWGLHLDLTCPPRSPDVAKSLLPADAAERKTIPLSSGVLDYFTSALIEVAKVSDAGNRQHNPGQPLHWARGKSTDQADTMLRHFVERGSLDTDGQRHSAKMVWRALAILQLEVEAEGAPIARGAIEPKSEKF